MTLSLAKPVFGSNCNRCGFCCATEPCRLANEFLNCHTGPCVALEEADGVAGCGLTRNPIAYLFRAAHPTSDVDVLGEPPHNETAHQLSVQIATALGLGMGCDAEDDEASRAWGVIPIVPIR